jgi:hypothetical protein
MIIRPPPRTGNSELDSWLEEVHEWAKYPHVQAIRYIPQSADWADAAEGALFAENSTNILQYYNGTQYIDVPYSSSTDYSRLQMGFGYWVDSSEADQGATAAAGSDTVKDYVDAIGTTKKATLMFEHDASAGDTTTYTFSTNETIPSNIYLLVKPGAILSIDSGKTLTVYSPENIIASSRQQIFSGLGAISFSSRGGQIYPEWWYSGSGNYNSAMSSAIASQPEEGIPIILQSGHYTFTSSIQPIAQNATTWNPLIILGQTSNTAQGTIDSYDEGQTVLDFEGVSGFDFTGREAHYIHLENLYIYGNNTALTYGLEFDDKISGSVFRNLQFKNFENGIRHEGSTANGMWYCLFDNIKSYYNTSHGIYLSTDSNGTKFHRVISTNNTGNGILFNAVAIGPTIDSSYFENNTEYGIRATTGLKFINILNSWFEGNTLEPIWLIGDNTELAIVNLIGNYILTKTDNSQEHLILSNIRNLNSFGNKFQNDPANKVYYAGAATTINVTAIGNSYYGITSTKIASGGVNITRITDDNERDFRLAGKIRYAATTVSAVGPTDNVDVANVNVVEMDTSGNSVTIGGFINGQDGQVIDIVRTSTANNAILEHNEGTGNQDIFLVNEADQTLTTYGGWRLYCNGSNWYEIGH